MDKLDDSLNKMEVLTKHLNELVEDVLNMSKLESDHMEIVNEPFDLNYMVEELNSLIDAQVSLQNITYHKHMENVVHTHLIGDALQLRRILVNLLTNAIKYNKSMARLIRMSEKYRAMIQKLHLNLKLKIRELV